MDWIIYVIIAVFILIVAISPCLSAEPNTLGGESKYLQAVREFADNVLKYGRDTYGPKHTPLFVDGLNIHTHEPVKWIAPNGDRWILSNLASQQNLFRTLDGLTKLTDDPKYKQAAMEAIKYAFENLRSPNGLFYWGMTYAYDAGADRWRTGNDNSSACSWSCSFWIGRSSLLRPAQAARLCRRPVLHKWSGSWGPKNRPSARKCMFNKE